MLTLVVGSLEDSLGRLGLLASGFVPLGGVAGGVVAVVLQSRGKLRLRLDNQTIIPISVLSFASYGGLLGSALAVGWWVLTW
jgi:hypothetical protein